VTPAKLEKIRALADDVRGDPAIREVARRVLQRYAHVEPQPQPRPSFRDSRAPGMKTSPEYDRYKFMDLAQWRKTQNGNLSHTILHNRVLWQIILFQYKKTPTWGWLRIDTTADTSEFSGKFATLAQAHEDAWANLMSL
jgi:hypothetical protein